MELLIKMYPDKPFRIGIKYLYSYQAIKDYERLVTDHTGQTFNLTIEPVKNKVELTLQSEQTGAKLIYKNLEYKPELLKKLLICATDRTQIYFVYVYPDSNTLMIAKPFGRHEFILIKKLNLVHPNF